jgi:hypothetical protein
MYKWGCRRKKGKEANEKGREEREVQDVVYFWYSYLTE